MAHRATMGACLLLALFLASCSAPKFLPSATVSAPVPSAVLVADIKTATSTIIPKTKTPSEFDFYRRKVTYRPSATPEAAIQPSSTPTFTPTFNPSEHRTAISGRGAVCPQIASGAVPTPSFILGEDKYQIVKEQDYLDYLNRYGAESLYLSYKASGGKGWFGGIPAYQDFTNDGVPEIAIGRLMESFFIFGCQDGQYKTFYSILPYGNMPPARIRKIQDLNHNGFPEILLIYSITTGDASYSVVEWNGERFRDILIPPEMSEGFDENIIYQDEIGVSVTLNGDIGAEDFDKDGRQEYVANIGIPNGVDGIPWRQEKQYYRWNGKEYLYYRSVFSPPEYRFQAVQDGDRASFIGEYEKAQDFYQQAIFSDKLDWWSPQRAEFLRQVYIDKKLGADHLTPTPIPPQPDPLEYDHLAAYARYRIMLLHAARGWVSDAKTVYDTLQQKYPVGKTGHIYAALAETFWNEFMVSKNMDLACAKAIQFATHNAEETYAYIYSEYHGVKRIDYLKQLEYVCPFK
jgi:hypothetical protein